jgi:ferredoxin
MTRRIVLDPILCDRNGLCALEAPAHFALDANDELQLLKDTCEADETPAVERAIRACPKAALRLAGSEG